MTIEPLSIPDLIKAIAWPGVAAAAIVVFRKPAAEVLRMLVERLSKISVAGVSVELSLLSELRPRSLDTELRELNSAAPPPSGPTALLNELQFGGSHEYIVIDLGADTAPRWLSSRLYLFAVMLSRISRLKCFVFVEAAGGIRNRFIGIASPDAVRWALARRYPWLEFAYARVYPQIGLPQFEPSTGTLALGQMQMIVSQFLAAIRIPNATPLPFPDPTRPPETIDLGNGVLEYAKWLDGRRVERILGSDLSTESIQIPRAKPSRTLWRRQLGAPGVSWLWLRQIVRSETCCYRLGSAPWRTN
jgi:hypothetical protein